MRTTQTQLEVDAQVTLFGFTPTPIVVTILPRSRRWRVTNALATFLVTVSLTAPLVIFPPHAVWLLGGLGVGTFLAHRRYIERFTLMSATGQCPKCEHTLSLSKMRLRSPHPLPCDLCHHESVLSLPRGTLQGHARD